MGGVGRGERKWVKVSEVGRGKWVEAGKCGWAWLKVGGGGGKWLEMGWAGWRLVKLS